MYKYRRRNWLIEKGLSFVEPIFDQVWKIKWFGFFKDVVFCTVLLLQVENNELPFG